MIRRLPWYGIAALVTLGVLVGLAAAAPAIAAALGVSALDGDLLQGDLPPDATHWLGTDALGRDRFAQILHAGRASLGLAVAGGLGATALGALLGIAAAAGGGRLEVALRRVADGALALPALPVVVVVQAVAFQRLGLGVLDRAEGLRLVVVLVLLGWPGTMLLVRAEARSVLARDHVRAARALGVGGGALLWRHVLPHLLAPVATAAALAMGGMMVAESALSFLGLGLNPPALSWGVLLTDASEALWVAPARIFAPALLLVLAAGSFAALGAALAVAADPRRRGRKDRVGWLSA